MIKKLLLAAVLIMAPTLATAQTAAQVIPGNPSIGGPGCPAPQACFYPTTASPPLGYQQLTSLAGSTALTVPAGAVEAFIVCETQTVRWRDDGVAPTASVGMPLPVNAALPYVGKLSAFRLIETTASATCNVSYYQ